MGEGRAIMGVGNTHFRFCVKGESNRKQAGLKASKMCIFTGMPHLVVLSIFIQKRSTSCLFC